MRALREQSAFEVWALVSELCIDPSSHVAAAVAGWEYPASREELALATLIDSFVRANTPKRRQGSIKPYPRPWDKKVKPMRPTVPQSKVRAALAARGHA